MSSLTTTLVIFNLPSCAVLKSLWWCFREEGIQNYCIYSIQFTCTLSTKHIHTKPDPANDCEEFQGLKGQWHRQHFCSTCHKPLWNKKLKNIVAHITSCTSNLLCNKFQCNTQDTDLLIQITCLRPMYKKGRKSLLVAKIISYFKSQCAKKFMSDSLRLVDCVTGLVNSVSNLHAEQVKFFGDFKLQKNCIESCSTNIFFTAVKETLRLVHARYSLPKWQAVKLTFFTP